LNTLLLLLALAFFSPAQAENMLMARVHDSFEETMIQLKETLNDYGYRIAHIQKCDGGLSGFGYKTDLYKSVFFGKFGEMRRLTRDYPEFIPYLPLKIVVMKEKDTVLLVALNPTTLEPLFPDPELRIQFERWESDIRAIFEELRTKQQL
jgi:uncharacterized protein (DUF302 family)